MEEATEGKELKLTGEEAELLEEMLDTDLKDLREEIYKTEDYDYRQALKHRETLINAVIDRLSPARTAYKSPPTVHAGGES